MKVIKQSMAVFPSPIDKDGVTVPLAPRSGDHRWAKDEYFAFGRKWEGPWGYKIKRVTNSTAFNPGWLLTKAKLNDLINEGWTITINSDV